MSGALDLCLLALGAIVVWWGSTGVLLLMMGRDERTYATSMAATATVAIAGAIAVLRMREVETTRGAVVAFVAAIAIWGAIELAFLMGYVVGPRKQACPPGATGWARFRASFEALAYHELALVASMLGLLWMVAGAANQLAFQIFALMWVMRLSTKLNIFLGVANVSDELLPARVAYLKTYFRKAPINPLFPVSVTGATGLVVFLGAGAAAPNATDFQIASSVILCTFAALALIEHWMLVLPLPASTFWPWCPEAAPTAPQQHDRINAADRPYDERSNARPSLRPHTELLASTAGDR